VCSHPLDPTLHGLGYRTHPNCDPTEQLGSELGVTAVTTATQPALTLDGADQAQPAAPETGLSGADQHGRDELHAAFDFLAAMPGPAAAVDGPGFAETDIYLGMFLADLPADHWTDEMAIAGWSMLGRYTDQLGEAGISYERLPCPAGAEHMDGAQLATAHEIATQEMAAIWPGMLRSRFGPRYVRCDTAGAPVMLGYGSLTDTDLVRQTAQIPGLHGYVTADQVAVFSFASLPDVVALAERHGIPVTEHVRGLAAAATRQGSRDSVTAPPELAAVGAVPGQAAISAVPGLQPVTGSDLALALRRMGPQHFAELVENGRDPAWHQSDSSRYDDEPDPGASELVEFNRDGVRIRIGAQGGTRDRALTWPQIHNWIQPGLTPARRQLLAAAVRTVLHYSILVSGYAVPGTPAHDTLRHAARELDAIQQRVVEAIISLALARRGSGPLSHRVAAPVVEPGDTDELLPLPGEGDRSAAEAADLNRVDELAGVLPAWPPSWSKPVSEIRPGDILRGPPHAPALFIVTEPPRRTETGTELAGTVGDPDGPVTTRIINHDSDADPQVEVIPADGPLTGPIPPAPASAAPAHEVLTAPPGQALALTASGSEADQDGQGQPALLAGPGAQPGGELAVPGPPGTAGIDRVPSEELPVLDHRHDRSADPAQPLPGPQESPRRPAFEGISPLHGAAAASQGRWRPHRLVYPDGTPLICRPDGRFGPAWTGTAAGRIPAPGDAGGWLQAFLRSDGSLHIVHPAVVAPAGVNPYALMSYRDQQRFSQFDQAEAAGHDAAWIYAELVDIGDIVRIQAQPGDGAEIRAVTGMETAGIRVEITTAGPGADSRPHPYLRRDRVEVRLPVRHPAEDDFLGGARLFAPRSEQIRPGSAAAEGLTATRPATDREAIGLGSDVVADLQRRVADLEREVALLRAAGTAGPAAAADGRVWGPAAASAERLRQAQVSAGQAIAGLRQEWLWTQLRDLTDSASRLTRDVLSGRLRFADLPQALGSWRGLWARVCELTGDLADAVMARLRPDGSSWRAARRLRHAATEGAAHARGWLAPGENLPPGSYDPPPGHRAPTSARADAATQLHQAGAGPLSQIEFPGPLAGTTARTTPGPHARRRVARTAAARSAQHPAHPAGRP
jgi:hypothetical protein